MMKNLLLLILVFCFYYGNQPVASVSNSSALCGQTQFTSDNGMVTFGPSSSSVKYCTYNIEVSRGRRIVLKWSKFKVNGNMPSCLESDVTVYTGCHEVKVAEFCSENMDALPHDIYSRDNCMKIKFTSTQATTEEFAASYETYPEDRAVDTSMHCSVKKYLSKKSGVFHSPSWPREHTGFSRKCEWDIELPSSYVIKVNFMDFKLLSTSSYGCKYSRERVRLKGEKSVLTTYKNKDYFCGTKGPFSRTTRYYELDVQYEVSFGSSSRGFIAGYVAYKTTATVKAAKKSNQLAYIGLALAVIVIVSCCVFFCLRRRRRQQNANNATYHAASSQEATAKVMTQQTPVSYGSGPAPGAAPPPYSTAVNQPPYQGYPAQQYQPAPYPGAAAPYPGAAAPYPGAAAPYPGAAAPYPGAAAPYPGVAAPYPGTDAPYPPGGAPYPPTSAPGGYPTTESYPKSADPTAASATAPPYPH